MFNSILGIKKQNFWYVIKNLFIDKLQCLIQLWLFKKQYLWYVIKNLLIYFGFGSIFGRYTFS